MSISGLQVHTYCCPQQHDICLLQGTRDTVCPHVPGGSPVKHQGEDSKWEDGSSKTEGFPAALSPVAKYLLGKNQNDPKYWLGTINSKWSNRDFGDKTGAETEVVEERLRTWRRILDKITHDPKPPELTIKLRNSLSIICAPDNPVSNTNARWYVILFKSLQQPLNRIMLSSFTNDGAELRKTWPRPPS